MRTLIRGGRVAASGRLVHSDVLVEDGRIAALGSRLEATADRVLDASGAFVLPGFIDIHTHLDDRIGRFELADDYERGTRAAVLNGITTVGSFVTQGEGESLAAALRRARAKAQGRLHADLFWHLTPTTFTEADLAFLDSLPPQGYRTLKLYSTYREAGIYADYARMAMLFHRLKGWRFLVHCEDDARMSTVDASTLDLSAPISHARLRDVKAEAEAIRMVARLASEACVAAHIVHVSSPEGAQAVAEGRTQAELTCETCPQYLWLDESWLSRPNGHRWICSPPLRRDAAAHRDLARSGAFEVLATDHCAFRTEDKDNWDHRDIRTVANGLPGVGALAHLAWKVWEDDPEMAALALAKHLAQEPARIAGIAHRKGALEVGLDADVVVLDPGCTERALRGSLSEVHDPYADFTSPLSFRHVLRRGEVVVAHDALCEADGLGGLLLQGDPGDQR